MFQISTMEDYECSREILTGDVISGDTINKFYKIVRKETQFNPQDVYKMGVWELIDPVEKNTKAIQILPSHATYELNEVSHWITVLYNGDTFIIYDSLNMKSITPQQKKYIQMWSNQNEPKIQYSTVQQQPNMVNCGVFTIAFATSILCNRNPKTELYAVENMREHLWKMLQSQQLRCFPTKTVNKLGRYILL